MDLMKRLVARWTEHDIAIRSGATDSAIFGFEARHRVSLPADFREYISTVDGMGEIGTTDNDLFCFFALTDLVSIAENVPDRAAKFDDAGRYFIFADHSISLPSFAIRLTDDPAIGCPVAAVFTDSGALDVEIFFESFTDFLRSYLDDPNGTGATFPHSV